MELVVDNWRESDSEEFAEWFEFDPDMSRAIGFPHHLTKGEVEGFILELTREEILGTGILRAVRDEKDELISFICVRNIHGVAGTVHIAIAPWHQRQGVAKLVTAKCVEAAKEDGRLKKLIAIPYMVPIAMQEPFLKSLGFGKMFMVGEMDI